MGKRTQRDKSPRYVALYHHLLESQAWKSLGAIPRAVYVDIVKRYHGSNNGRIGYSIRCAVDELHIGNATAKRALDVLEERGFLVATKRGAFSLKVRHATEWRLTQFPSDATAGISTKDFMSWRPDQNKSRYPQRKQPDAVAEAIGCCSGSNPSPDTSNGVCSGSVNAGIAA